MATLAESLVDEWMNRQGFFTVRGIKHGVHKIDLLGVRPTKDSLEAWHVEVQASFRLIGYLCSLLAEHIPSFAKSTSSAKSDQATYSNNVCLPGCIRNFCQSPRRKPEIQRGQSITGVMCLFTHL